MDHIRDAVKETLFYVVVYVVAWTWIAAKFVSRVIGWLRYGKWMRLCGLLWARKELGFPNPQLVRLFDWVFSFWEADHCRRCYAEDAR